MLAKLLALLEAGEADKFAGSSLPVPPAILAHLRATNKGNKAIERELISSNQVAQSLGFNGDFRAWEHLLRINE